MPNASLSALSFPWTPACPGQYTHRCEGGCRTLIVCMPLASLGFTFHFLQQAHWICENDGTSRLTVTSWGNAAESMCDCFQSPIDYSGMRSTRQVVFSACKASSSSQALLIWVKHQSWIIKTCIVLAYPNEQSSMATANLHNSSKTSTAINQDCNGQVVIIGVFDRSAQSRDYDCATHLISSLLCNHSRTHRSGCACLKDCLRDNAEDRPTIVLFQLVRRQSHQLFALYVSQSVAAGTFDRSSSTQSQFVCFH